MPQPGYVKSLKDKFFIKRNDTLPTLDLVVIDRACAGNKIPFNLSGVTACTFTMTNDCGDIKIMAKPAQITSYSGGNISYNWEPEDTNESGMYSGEFKLFFSDGSIMSLPPIGNISIEIFPTLNNF